MQISKPKLHTSETALALSITRLDGMTRLLPRFPTHGRYVLNCMYADGDVVKTTDKA